MSKLVSAAQAAAMVPDGATVLVDGSGGGVNEPGLVLAALEARFVADGRPTRLTVVHPSGMGNGVGSGIDHFAHEGMVTRAIGGHWSWCPAMQELATSGKIEAYCLPQGVLSHLFRAIAGGRPGVVTHVGLGTFVDPRVEGGRLNARSREALVELLTLRGREYLFYPSFPIDVAIIRGSTADTLGNVSMEAEGLYAEVLSAAQAAKNSSGKVIVQVKRIVPAGSLDPRVVKVPGVIVDAIVVDAAQRLSWLTVDDPSLYGAARVEAAAVAPLPLDARKVIARRAACELRIGDVANLGYGMPDGVATVLAEEGQADAVTFTLEQGHISGIPATGADFGLARNQFAMLDAGYQFDWYDGGGLDIAILSFAQVDAQGNVNVSKFGGRIAGIGGFVNISQGARRVVFVGTFKAGAQRLAIRDGGLQIEAEAPVAKFVAAVEQISFGAGFAHARRMPVLYVTERAVFELTPAGLMLTEVAAGLDVERDVLAQMGFRPAVATPLRRMDPALFGASRMGLRLGAHASSAAIDASSRARVAGAGASS
ncbi:MAG: acyl CoA:acetate/3-ketoacid CoA transferase [Burkholderiales bacterium]|nr:acyl CoA:acetate/3-ketoacid CoA transferase [Burkholderiales bacterium]